MQIAGISLLTGLRLADSKSAPQQDPGQSNSESLNCETSALNVSPVLR